MCRGPEVKLLAVQTLPLMGRNFRPYPPDKSLDGAPRRLRRGVRVKILRTFTSYIRASSRVGHESIPQGCGHALSKPWHFHCSPNLKFQQSQVVSNLKYSDIHPPNCEFISCTLFAQKSVYIVMKPPHNRMKHGKSWELYISLQINWIIYIHSLWFI
jgi:hypothetical protein